MPSSSPPPQTAWPCSPLRFARLACGCSRRPWWQRPRPKTGRALDASPPRALVDGIRANAASLKKQLELTGQLDFLRFPYHQAIAKNEVPLSIGGGIGQSRTYRAVLKKAHLGGVSVTVWPKVLKQMCATRNIHVLE